MNLTLEKRLKEIKTAARSEAYIPTDLSYFCEKGVRLDDIEMIDTSKCTKFCYTFYNNTTSTTLPKIDTSKGVDFTGMYSTCANVTSFSKIDTSNGTTFAFMYNTCTKATSFPKIDTSNGTDFKSMFNNSMQLKSAPELDTSKGTDFNNMFNNNTSLRSIPELNTSNGINFVNMCSSCYALRTVSGLDLNNAEKVSNMFNSCYNLTSLRLYNIRISLQIGSGTSWGHLLDQDSLIHTLNELCTAETQQTLTLATASKTTLSSLYCKVTDDTTEKKPMVLCESTDDGAMTIDEYVALKNWTIA